MKCVIQFQLKSSSIHFLGQIKFVPVYLIKMQAAQIVLSHCIFIFCQ